jgi:hypothetical protein
MVSIDLIEGEPAKAWRVAELAHRSGVSPPNMVDRCACSGTLNNPPSSTSGFGRRVSVR